MQAVAKVLWMRIGLRQTNQKSQLSSSFSKFLLLALDPLPMEEMMLGMQFSFYFRSARSLYVSFIGMHCHFFVTVQVFIQFNFILFFAVMPLDH